jgi:hypothetical protein
MARRTWIGISSAALAAVVTGALTTPLWAAAPVVMPSSSSEGEVDPIAPDDPRCADGHGTATTAPAEMPPPGAVTQTITVTVPRTAIVSLDADGSVVAAMTNTGCPPREGDEFWVRHAGAAELEPASWWTFRTHRWQGDFSRPGLVVAQLGD